MEDRYVLCKVKNKGRILEIVDTDFLAYQHSANLYVELIRDSSAEDPFSGMVLSGYCRLPNSKKLIQCPIAEEEGRYFILLDENVFSKDGNIELSIAGINEEKIVISSNVVVMKIDTSNMLVATTKPPETYWEIEVLNAMKIWYENVVSPELNDSNEKLSQLILRTEENEEKAENLHAITVEQQKAVDVSITNASKATKAAADAAQNADAKASAAQTAADNATKAAQSANTAASAADTSKANADKATTAANDAAGKANTAADKASASALTADDKAKLANDAAGSANKAASDANIATQSANTAASAADTSKANADKATTAANDAAGKANTAADNAIAKADAADKAAVAANTAKGAADNATKAATEKVAEINQKIANGELNGPTVFREDGIIQNIIDFKADRNAAADFKKGQLTDADGNVLLPETTIDQVFFEGINLIDILAGASFYCSEDEENWFLGNFEDWINAGKKKHP